MSFEYPEITNLKIIPFKMLYGALKEHPDLLDRPECPYTTDVKTFLKAIMLREVKAPVELQANTPNDDEELDIMEGLGSEEFDQVDVKLKKLIAQLEKVANSLKIGDTNEQIQVAKTQAQLFDRLLQMRERAMNLKTIAEFQEMILKIMDEEIPAEIRTAIMARVREAAGL